MQDLFRIFSQIRSFPAMQETLGMAKNETVGDVEKVTVTGSKGLAAAYCQGYILHLARTGLYKIYVLRNDISATQKFSFHLFPEYQSGLLYQNSFVSQNYCFEMCFDALCHVN